MGPLLISAVVLTLYKEVLKITAYVEGKFTRKK